MPIDPELLKIISGGEKKVDKESNKQPSSSNIKTQDNDNVVSSAVDNGATLNNLINVAVQSANTAYSIDYSDSSTQNEIEKYKKDV